jgi:integrase
MATVRKHGRSYQLVYQVDGQPHWETVHVKTESEARRELEIRVGRALEGRSPTASARRLRIKDLAGDLERDWKITGRHDLKSLPARMEHLKHFFDRKPACEMTTADVRGYITHRQEEGAASGTINRELAALKRMFNLALRAEQLYRKPYIPMLRENPPRQGFFEGEEFARVLAELPVYLRRVAEFGYYTGWRRGEITSLRWDQVDLAQHTVRLWAGTTKNDESRVLPLGPELLRIIEEQRKERVEGCPWVFHRKGRRTLTFYKAWKEACENAGCPGRFFHDLRRTAARNFTRAGITTGEAMALGGWKTDSTFKRYSITQERDLPDAAWRAQAFLAEGLRKACQKSANGVLDGESQDGQQVKKSV